VPRKKSDLNHWVSFTAPKIFSAAVAIVGLPTSGRDTVFGAKNMAGRERRGGGRHEKAAQADGG